MRIRIITAALLVAMCGGVVACQPTDDSKDTNTSASPASSDGPEEGGSAKDDKPVSEKATVPDVVGMGLQSAQDKAQEAGFYGLTSHDALGRDRMQAFDRNWKVCSQSVKAGTSAPTDTKLDFGTVKLEETCPAKEEKAPSTAGGKMPDFKGKSVKAARTALDSGTSLTVNDATAEDRMVLMESNWQVCSQDPVAGAALNGQPVTFTAVKFEESCP
ncbi:PASTA domain-containing protein [Streptomyces sp. NPDC016640]|uniref:PASTA domain-containing protein n=1 Tax=Streptomyces sp. NPDC016640 TaxID=3364969 RepID=UPI0036F6B801